MVVIWSVEGERKERRMGLRKNNIERTGAADEAAIKIHTAVRRAAVTPWSGRRPEIDFLDGHTLKMHRGIIKLM